MRQGFFSASGLLVPAKAPPLLVPHCGACGLKQLCRSPMMPVDGKGKRQILLVGESPGADEDRENRPFVGKAGRFLREVCEELDIDINEDCWITNSLICRPSHNKLGDVKRIDYCRPNLIKTIRELQPHTIILLGAVAVKSLIGWVWKENAEKNIGKWLGWQIPLQKLNAWVCPVWHPSHVMREDREGAKGKEQQALKRLLFKQQLQKAFSHTKRPWREVPNWKSQVKVILDPEQAAEAIREIYKDGSLVAFDTESQTLKPDGAYADLYSCSFSNRARTISFPWFGSATKAAKELLESNVSKTAHNLKHDTRYLRRYGIRVRGAKWCSMIAAHVLDNRIGTKGLKFLSFVLLGMDAYEETVGMYLKEDPKFKGSMGSNTPNRIKQAPLHDLLLYGGLDTLLTYKITRIQAKQLGVKL